MSDNISPDIKAPSESSSEINKTLRQRYTAVRPTVKRAIQKIFEGNAKKSDIRAIRKGSFYTAEELYEEAATDSLTKLARRGSFQTQTETAMRLVNRDQERSIGFISLDLDDFGRFNKTYNETAGDTTLALTGKTILENIRDTDIAGRWGGEELMVTLQQKKIDSDSTLKAAERIRESIEGMSIPVLGGKMIEHVTATMGITDYIPGETFQEMTERASIGVKVGKLFNKNTVMSVRKNEDGTYEVIDSKNGNKYTYDVKVENGDGRDTPGEYIIDHKQQLVLKIMKDENGKRHPAIYKKLDDAPETA